MVPILVDQHITKKVTGSLEEDLREDSLEEGEVLTSLGSIQNKGCQANKQKTNEKDRQHDH